MTRATFKIGDDVPGADETGTGFLLWGWIIVTLLNLGMVSVSLAVFAP